MPATLAATSTLVGGYTATAAQWHYPHLDESKEFEEMGEWERSEGLKESEKLEES